MDIWWCWCWETSHLYMVLWGDSCSDSCFDLSIQSVILNLTPKSEEKTAWCQALCLSLRNTETNTKRQVLVFSKLHICGTKSQKNSLKAYCNSQIFKSSASTFPCASAFYSFTSLFMVGHSHRAVTFKHLIFYFYFSILGFQFPALINIFKFHAAFALCLVAFYALCKALWRHSLLRDETQTGLYVLDVLTEFFWPLIFEGFWFFFQYHILTFATMMEFLYTNLSLSLNLLSFWILHFGSR